MRKCLSYKWIFINLFVPVTKIHLPSSFGFASHVRMAAAKKSSGKIPSYSEESPKEQFRYIAVLLGHVESEVKTIAEGQTYLTDKINQMDTKVESVRSELKEEIQLTQTALTQRMDDVEARLGKKIDGVEQRLSERMDGLKPS